MSFDFLFSPVEDLDAGLAGLLDGAPLLVALGLAIVLGLRHAADPDHLVAVTALASHDEHGPRAAVRLGAWWGIGHAGALLAIGIPLIGFKAELPLWLESGAERAIGVVIVALALLVIWNWARGPRASRSIRTPIQALAIGLLHGLAGTGAVVLLLIAALPTQLEAALALAVFAPMSIASMAALTGGWAWLLTRPAVAPVYQAVLTPVFGVFGVGFGLWFAGLA